jgi:arylsulfatase A-like enzyme
VFLAPGSVGASHAEVASSPSVVFILLDTTRADRFGAWGNPRPTSPHMDALAQSGIRFARHYANAHATRSSMPQLMSGRYYHLNILAPFNAYSHPREYPFQHLDPTAVLLPDMFRRAGYDVVGVSAHPWVVAESAFGAAFRRLEFLPAPPERGHAGAAAVVDRALSLWAERARATPTFLYVHLMDLHMPRWLPDGELGFVDADAAPAWRERFADGSRPLFGAALRAWDPEDARDFTERDRAAFVAFYDTLLAYTDAQVGRLLDAVRAEDPGLRSVLVVVVADHGEELGEEGRTGHTSSLSDGIQHIPFVLAGASIQPGQRFERFSENVDVAPTVAQLVGLDAAPSAFDGHALVARDGRACETCGGGAVFYAWVQYQAIRKHGHLLRLLPRGAPEALCRGERTTLWRMRHDDREEVNVGGSAARRVARLRHRLERRLGPKEARFQLAGRGELPDRSFFVPAPLWRLAGDLALRCPSVDVEMDRGTLDGPGWQYARQSLFALGEYVSGTLSVSVAAPDGAYRVDAGIVDVARRPRLFGFDGWLDGHFRRSAAASFVPLGIVQARGGDLTVTVPGSVGANRRLTTLRLTPEGVAPADGPGGVENVDAAHRERLRALGYIQD